MAGKDDDRPALTADLAEAQLEDLQERARRADPAALDRILAKAGSDVPIPGDELPEGWLEEVQGSEGPRIK